MVGRLQKKKRWYAHCWNPFICISEADFANQSPSYLRVWLFTPLMLSALHKNFIKIPVPHEVSRHRATPHKARCAWNARHVWDRSDLRSGCAVCGNLAGQAAHYSATSPFAVWAWVGITPERMCGAVHAMTSNARQAHDSRNSKLWK